jgi:UDP-N-acetylmuramoyl-L-alanyl-D-glutamate--2,6-diaminopimelate ligase
MVKLKQLVKDLEGIQIKGSKEVEISGLSSHSKKVAPGDLFFAKRGTKTHGMEYIKDAFLAGAKAIVTDLYNPFYKDTTQIICNDVAKLEAILAKKFYQDPSLSLYLCGITGTNGKTTTSYLIQHLLSTKKKPCGLIGTIEVISGKNRMMAAMTTPDVLAINKYLKEMHVSNLTHCVMEVSSHALDQNRVAGLEFDHVIFTNITQDHLDYHGTFENYLEAKKKLFFNNNQIKKKSATINIDCPFGKEMASHLEFKTVSLKDQKADFFVSSYQLLKDKTKICLHHEGHQYKLSYPLVGVFNIYNVVEAISCAIDAKMTMEEIEKKLKLFTHVPGRLQRLNGFDFSVFVDFAHTEDALKQILMTLKQMEFERIILVFGCGGDRDKEKRALMGKVASDLADLTILTNDNPRSEEPAKIIEMIESGMKKDAKKHVILDRKEAIFFALQTATKKDCVLIAGKGHENFQIFQNKTVEFNDAEIALSFLNPFGEKT